MQLPSFLDWFGWCTWDAFYTDVTADGVKQGLQRFASVHLMKFELVLV
jgi:raffinose synthase